MNLDDSISEYSKRLGKEPVCVVPDIYALWRTREVNLSITVKPDEAGQLRHLGFEDEKVPEMLVEYDINGFMWEYFTASQQRAEIFDLWDNASYPKVPE